MKLPSPRILPITTTAIAVLLVVKCAGLLEAAMTNGQPAGSVVVTQANAAGPEKENSKAPPNRSPPLAPPPADVPKHDPAPAAASLPAPTPSVTAPEGPPPVSESERVILQQLRQRRKEIDARESNVSARESLLAATEQKLKVRVGELQALQQKLEGLDAAQKQKEEAGWQAMVKLYEAMKPKDAAAILTDLPMPVLVPLMDRMKPAKAAAVMAAMAPEKARDVTSELAQMRTGQDATTPTPDPGPKPPPIGG